MSDFVRSLIRTYAPNGVGAVLGWLVGLGLPIGTEARLGIAAAATFLLGGVWYLTVRMLEKRWPRSGVLLGSPKAPSYPVASKSLAKGDDVSLDVG